MITRPWTEEELQQAIDLALEGKTAGQAAKILTDRKVRSDCAAITRNTICGLWDRNRDRIGNRHLARKEQKANEPKVQNPEPVKEQPKVEVAPEPEKEEGDFFTLDNTPIMKLKPWECRYPFGDPTQNDFKYCGEKIDYRTGQSYCTEHYKLCYYPHKGNRL
jgi:GcrA cell cycle regulator